MARLTFPSDRLVYKASAYAGSAFSSSSGSTATVYSDAGGTTLADVQNIDGSANATATFTVDSTSRLPLFLGPASGTDTLYVKIDAGPVTAIYAVTAGDISSAVGVEVAARQTADAALAKPRGAWVTATAYAVNDVVTSGGAAYRCLVAHTSGGSFSGAGTNWEAWGSNAAYSPATRSNTLASLSDSLGTGGANPVMAVAVLAAPASAGATTISITSIQTPGVSTDFGINSMLKVGSGDYVTTHLSTAPSGSGPYTITLAGSGLPNAHAAGEPVISVPTFFNNGAPPAGLVASILSGGQLRFGGTYGHGSATAEQIRDIYLPLVLAAKPGYCYVMAGHNNLVGDGNATTIANAVGVVTGIWDSLLAGGVLPIASTLPPINSVTAQMLTDNQRMNSLIHREATKRGLPLYDFYADMVDPSTGGYLSGLNADTVHPSYKGRFVQGAGVWAAVSSRVPTVAAVFPSTQTYGDQAVHPMQTKAVNALNLTGGGFSGGGGSTSDVSNGWQTGIVDATGVITRPTAPDSVGKSIHLPRTAGGTSGTVTADMNYAPFTVTAGHRYRLTAKVITSGVNAAATADAGFPTGNGGWVLRVTDNAFGGYNSIFGLDQMWQDVNGALVTDLVIPSNGPTSIKVYVALKGTASTPAYALDVWRVDLEDLTALGNAAQSVWPL